MIYEIFDSSLPRLSPGDKIYTKKALDMLYDGKPVPDSLKVLDIGCGNGAQTIELAKRINGTITAVDNHLPYLEELMKRAEKQGIAEKIKPLLKDMAHMEMSESSFDLIWSEGALYSIGFAEGLKLCGRLLRKG
jgi:cyclopropane fatty-acyl-phospholipid synthase-like methyltransferase